MGQFAGGGITVPAAFARAISEWKESSFAVVMRVVEDLMTGRVLRRRTGAALRSVKSESGLEPFGFRLKTTHVPLIALIGPQGRRAYTVRPRRASILSWVDPDSGRRIFARQVNIPRRPATPVFEPAVASREAVIRRSLEQSLQKAMGQLFPDITIRWRL